MMGVNGWYSANCRMPGPILSAGMMALLNRFVLTGDPELITARLRPLAGLGIAGVVLAGAVAGVEDRLGALVPALRAGLAPEEDR